MVDLAITNLWEKLQEDGFIIFTTPLKADRDEIRSQIRSLARKEHIRIRSADSFFNNVALIVRTDRFFSDEDRDFILKETEYHVCDDGNPDNLISFAKTPFCCWCGRNLDGSSPDAALAAVLELLKKG